VALALLSAGRAIFQRVRQAASPYILGSIVLLQVTHPLLPKAHPKLPPNHSLTTSLPLCFTFPDNSYDLSFPTTFYDFDRVDEEFSHLRNASRGAAGGVYGWDAREGRVIFRGAVHPNPTAL